MTDLEQLIADSKARETARIQAEEQQANQQKYELELAAERAGARSFEKCKHLIPKPLAAYRLPSSASEAARCGTHEGSIEYLSRWEPHTFSFKAPGLATIKVSIARVSANRPIEPVITCIQVYEPGGLTQEFTADRWDAAIVYAARQASDDEDLPF